MTVPASPSPATRLAPAAIVTAADLLNYQDGAVVSRVLIKQPAGTITIFAFAEGEGLSEHTAPFDALVQVIEGDAEITISGRPHQLQGGQMLLLPARQPHAVQALTRFKMLLTMIRT